jgi:hypothetical protein
MARADRVGMVASRNRGRSPPGRNGRLPRRAFTATDKRDSIAAPSETRLFPQAGQPQRTKVITMGDRSPKSVQKQASQKQTKANDVQQQKQRALLSKQAGNQKKK